jgi:hypothetical protein
MLPWFKAMRWTRATSRSHGPAPINRRPSKGLTRHVVHAADHYERFDALLENCVFYISRMYEFLRSQPTSSPHSASRAFRRGAAKSRKARSFSGNSPWPA